MGYEICFRTIQTGIPAIHPVFETVFDVHFFGDYCENQVIARNFPTHQEAEMYLEKLKNERKD